MNRIRVAFLAPHARATDGWGRYAVELTDEVRQYAVDPVVITADASVDPQIVDVERHPVLPPLFAGRFELARLLASAAALRRTIEACDAVHVLAEPYLPLAALAARRRQPVVLTAHGTWAVRPFASPFRRWLWRPPLRRVDLLVCQSHFTRDAMARHVALPRARVLPAGVRADRFARRTAPSRPSWLPPGPVVFSVAAGKARKGTHVAIDAIAQACRHHPDLQFVVAGCRPDESPYVRALSARAAALGIAKALHLIGTPALADLVAWYQRADVFLLLPEAEGGAFEGLGLVYLEAGAASVPVIGTYGCGAEDAILDGQTGVLVPPGDATAAATALDRLLGDPDARARLGAAGLAHARIVSWSRLARALADEYRRAIADRLGRRQRPGDG